MTKEIDRAVSVTGAAIAKCLNYFLPSNLQIDFEQKKLVKKPEKHLEILFTIWTFYLLEQKENT